MRERCGRIHSISFFLNCWTILNAMLANCYDKDLSIVKFFIKIGRTCGITEVEIDTTFL